MTDLRYACGRFAAHRALPRSPSSPWPSGSAPTPPFSASSMRRCCVRCRCATRRTWSRSTPTIRSSTFRRFSPPSASMAPGRSRRADSNPWRPPGPVLRNSTRGKGAALARYRQLLPDPGSPAGDRPRLHSGGRPARAPNFVLIGYELWTAAFGRDPAISGKTLTVKCGELYGHRRACRAASDRRQARAGLYRDPPGPDGPRRYLPVTVVRAAAAGRHDRAGAVRYGRRGEPARHPEFRLESARLDVPGVDDPRAAAEPCSCCSAPSGWCC